MGYDSSELSSHRNVEEVLLTPVRFKPTRWSFETKLAHPTNSWSENSNPKTRSHICDRWHDSIRWTSEKHVRDQHVFSFRRKPWKFPFYRADGRLQCSMGQDGSRWPTAKSKRAFKCQEGPDAMQTDPVGSEVTQVRRFCQDRSCMKFNSQSYVQYCK